MSADFLDLRTVFILSTIVSLTTAIMMHSLWRSYPNDASLPSWALGAALVAAGYLLITLRNQAPFWMTIPLANSLIAIGHAFFLRGVERLVNKPPIAWPVILGLAAVVFGGLSYFTYFQFSTAHRMGIQFSVIGSLALFTAYRLWVAAPPAMNRLTYRSVALVFLIYGGTLLGRVVLMTVDVPAQNLFSPNKIHAVVFTMLLLFYAALMYCFPTLLFAKEKAEIESWALFPAQDPNPVMRFSADGVLRNANVSSRIILEKMQVAVGEKLSPDWAGMIRDACDSGKTRTMELEIGGSWLLLDVVPIVSHGYVNIYGKDITERKRAELALNTFKENLERRVDEEVQKNLAQERLLIQQSRQAAMGEMIGNIAHQWRQPINAMGLILANLKDAYEFDELDKEYLDQEVRLGEELIQRMAGTIDDFRNFFKPNKEKEYFLVSDEVEEAIKLIAHSYRSHNIALSVDSSKDPCIAYGYPNEFAQVVVNALSNAKDAILGQEIPGSVKIGVTKDEQAITVTIRDNGGGIPEEVLGQVFEPYFTTKEKGTGIGLYMSKMIMDHMNGDICVSNVDAGAEVKITLPPAAMVAPGSAG